MYRCVCVDTVPIQGIQNVVYNTASNPQLILSHRLIPNSKHTILYAWQKASCATE